MRRDAEDLNTFVSWLSVHNPFAVKFNKYSILCSEHPGIKVDASINCEKAKIVGKGLLGRMKYMTLGI